MARILQVQLYISDESGCPFGTDREIFSAVEESAIWTVQRVTPQVDEKKGHGATRRLAVIDWFYKNTKAD